VDESVCHLQDSSFQVSLGREDAVPVWVGMGWLATKSGEVPESEHWTAKYPLIKLPRAELKLWLISSVAQSSLLLHPNIRTTATASWIVEHHTLALLFLGSAARAILGFFMAIRSDLCRHHLTLIYS
jgi:hypothetical protein